MVFKLHKLTEEVWDYDGFRKDGTHKETNTKFNPSGYDLEGFNQNGSFDSGLLGTRKCISMDLLGFNSLGIHTITDTYKDQYGKTRLDYAIEEGNGDDKYYILYKILEGDLEFLMEYLDEGGRDAPIIIHAFFAVKNSIQMISLLIDHGASVSIEDSRCMLLSEYIKFRIELYHEVYFLFDLAQWLVQAVV